MFEAAEALQPGRKNSPKGDAGQDRSGGVGEVFDILSQTYP